MYLLAALCTVLLLLELQELFSVQDFPGFEIMITSAKFHSIISWFNLIIDQMYYIHDFFLQKLFQGFRGIDVSSPFLSSQRSE